MSHMDEPYMAHGGCSVMDDPKMDFPLLEQFINGGLVVTPFKIYLCKSGAFVNPIRLHTADLTRISLIRKFFKRQ